MEQVKNTVEDKKNLKSFSFRELVSLMRDMGEKPYRATQIFNWIWRKGETDIMKFSDIKKSFRERLAEEFFVPSIVEKQRVESEDGSVKFIFELPDGHEIESVFIPDRGRKTVCVSTQVGCPIGCKFCATGLLLGYKRNLEAWEIAEQVLRISLALGIRITNVVYMGMGEPFLNYEATIRSAELLNDDRALNIGARKITISTVGIVPGIYKLAAHPRQFKLAISLHSAIQSKREKIIPVARRFPLKELRKAIFSYYHAKKRFVTFEYVLLPGFNDSDEDIEAIDSFLKGLPSKINIIPFNPFPGSDFRAPTDDEIYRFYTKLMKLPYTVTLRKSKGQDVKAACGQLALFGHQRKGMVKPVVKR